MKIIISMVIILYSISSLADNIQTIIDTKSPPTEKQVKTAIKILEEALEAKAFDDEKTYKEKIKKSQGFLKDRYIETTYRAQVLCGRQIIRKWDDATGCIFNGPDSLCFKGEVVTANELFKVLVEANVFTWDSEKYDNPRVKSETEILLDFRSYSWKDTIRVKRCN